MPYESYRETDVDAGEMGVGGMVFAVFIVISVLGFVVYRFLT